MTFLLCHVQHHFHHCCNLQKLCRIWEEEKKKRGKKASRWRQSSFIFHQPFWWVWVPSSSALQFQPAEGSKKNLKKNCSALSHRITSDSWPSSAEGPRFPLLAAVFSHLQERRLSGLLHQQMKLVDLLPHQGGDGVTAGNDALRLSGKIETRTLSQAAPPGYTRKRVASERVRLAHIDNNLGCRGAAGSELCTGNHQVY